MAKKANFAIVDRRERQITYEFGAPSYQTRKYVVLLEATSRTKGSVTTWRLEPRKFLWFKYNKKICVGVSKIEDIVDEIKRYSTNCSYDNNRDYWARILQESFDKVIFDEKWNIERDYEYNIRISKGYSQKLGK